MQLAAAHGASSRVIVGDDLLTEGYPAVHMVGRASTNPPQLIDLRWAPAGADAASLPRVTLVGKGVSFDTGGLDLKPANGMKARAAPLHPQLDARLVTPHCPPPRATSSSTRPCLTASPLDVCPPPLPRRLCSS